jgi:hypothetical protein
MWLLSMAAIYLEIVKCTTWSAHALPMASKEVLSKAPCISRNAPSAKILWPSADSILLTRSWSAVSLDLPLWYACYEPYSGFFFKGPILIDWSTSLVGWEHGNIVLRRKDVRFIDRNDLASSYNVHPDFGIKITLTLMPRLRYISQSQSKTSREDFNQCQWSR